MARKPTQAVRPERVEGPRTLQALFEQQQQQDLLRFITCGSVDDGKSTLIGRQLWESHQLI
jgi:bifunctional enzyme CysN/CysC